MILFYAVAAAAAGLLFLLLRRRSLAVRLVAAILVFVALAGGLTAWVAAFEDLPAGHAAPYPGAPQPDAH